jgi:hypothetical protein
MNRVFPHTALAWLSGFAVVGGMCAMAAEVPSIPPDELVRRTVWNEMQATKETAKYRFRDRKETPHGPQTKLMVETRDAMAGIVIAIDDRPLTAEEREAENSRVDRFVKDPDELKKRQKQEQDDTEHTERIMKALPDAFLFQYDGTEPGGQGIGKPGDTLVRLSFHPNPKYDPPSRVEQVLVGMEGYLLIDARQDRIARIDGRLQKEVSFGWGILGHLDRGGHFLVEQGDVGNGNWELSHIALAITGKILVFKTISYKSDDTMSEFRSVPSDLTFAQGLELLRKQEAPLAENNRSGNPQPK